MGAMTLAEAQALLVLKNRSWQFVEAIFILILDLRQVLLLDALLEVEQEVLDHLQHNVAVDRVKHFLAVEMPAWCWKIFKITSVSAS